MDNPKNLAKTLSTQLVSSMIKHDITGWPPDCMMLAYQPVRPNSEENCNIQTLPSKE